MERSARETPRNWTMSQSVRQYFGVCAEVCGALDLKTNSRVELSVAIRSAAILSVDHPV